MTCIVGLVDNGSVWMGSDSAGVDGAYNLTIGTHPKVFRNCGCLIGYTTSFRMGQLLQYALRLPKMKEGVGAHIFMVTHFIPAVLECFQKNGFSKIENNRHEGGDFLVGVAGRLFHVCADYMVLESAKGVDSCGCGAAYALGSLWVSKLQDPRHRIETALCAAQEFSAGVRGPWHVDQLDGVRR